MGNGAAILGHAPKPVIDAVAAGLLRGQMFAAQTEDEIRLAERLVAMIPCAERVRLAISGSEAVQAALRLARAKTGRNRFIKFEGHYHGWLDSVFISTRPALNEAGPRDSPVAVSMSRGQAPSALDDVIVLPWNDEEALEGALAREGEDIAAVLMEPILCNCGVIVPKPGYLERARALASQAGAMLVFDEVITGFRFGLGGAQGLLGVTPDLAVFAKAVAGGFPLSFVAGRADVMDLFLPEGGTTHSGTYNGCLPAVIAAHAALDALAADGSAVLRRMRALAERLMAGLAASAKRHRVPVLIQGPGPVFCLLFTEAKSVEDFRSVAACDAAVLQRFVLELAARGVRTTARGVWFLSTAHGDAEIDTTLAAADEAFAELAAA
jgi:glutamate-1-semialdehyde 2,1-aminomutase